MDNSIVIVRLTEDYARIVRELIGSHPMNVRTPGDALLGALRNFQPSTSSADSLPLLKANIFGAPGLKAAPAPTAFAKRSGIRRIFPIPGSHGAIDKP